MSPLTLSGWTSTASSTPSDLTTTGGWGYRTPTPGELTVEATDARLYGKTLESLLCYDTLTQEGIRRCAVSTWHLTLIMDEHLDPATPSLYRDLVAERDRWKALAESHAPRPGILARLWAYLNPFTRSLP